ncbi:MAG: TonB family protein [Fulvivirga sp.]|uniref:M56 family metallopeptidase n=1 Tax=Fulvivirga sp. TaxID=1931237 RepID=UPI0032EAB801
MNNLFTYFVEANICLAVFGLLYIVLLKNETDFKFRRNFILIASLIALIIPLFKLGSFNSDNTLVQSIQTTILPELTIGQSVGVGETSASINWWYYTKLIYITVTILLSQYFLFQLMQVAWFYFSNRTEKLRNKHYTLVETNGTLPTFSFFNILFYDNSIELSDTDKSKIIKHELTHIRQGHSLDIILLELTKIVFWFNPICWFLRNEIQDVHEYLADESAIENSNADDYGSLLAQMALNKVHLSIGHHFSKSKTLKRLDMIKRMKRGVNKWKSAMIIPVVLLTVVIISCNDHSVDTPKTIEEKFTEGSVFYKVDESATPVGGFDKYYGQIAANLKYPIEARKKGIQGKVYIQFVVDEKGNVGDVKAVKGIGHGCDDAAVLAVQNSGKWSAPILDGKAVKQRIILPITFKLDDVDETKSSDKKGKFLEIEEV